MDRARAIAAELGGWFGPPLLSRQPGELTTATDVLDGRVRFAALGAVFAPVVFPMAYRGGLWSIGERSYLLPKLLLLFGHADRAWSFMPSEWSDSVQAVESFLNVDRSAALEVWTAGKTSEKLRKEQALQRARERVPQATRSAQKIVSNIRQGLAAHAEGESFTLDDVARIVRYQ